MSDELERAPLRQALYRRFMRFGCERDPILVWIFGSFAIMFQFYQSILMWVVIVALQPVAFYTLRQVAKHDPIFSVVLIRSLKYQDVYPGSPER